MTDEIKELLDEVDVAWSNYISSGQTFKKTLSEIRERLIENGIR